MPFGIYVGEGGRIVKPPTGISSGKEEDVAELERWIAGEDLSFAAGGSGRDATDPNVREADLRFALGSHLLAQGRQDEAMAEWRKARDLDPGNWIIHKQIWAVEHPEAFYQGPVDYGWQKDQLERERADGQAPDRSR